MNGQHPVDLCDYNEEVHNYLLNRGATEYKGWTSTFRPHGLRGFIPTTFPGCKPTHFGATIRVFFPTEDDVILFSVAYGHLILNTHSRKVNSLIEGNYD